MFSLFSPDNPGVFPGICVLSTEILGGVFSGCNPDMSRQLVNFDVGF